MQLCSHTRLTPGRHAAAIKPEWVFPWADPLVKREHHEPHWAARAGKVLATERVRLLGLLVSDARSVDYAKIDPVEVDRAAARRRRRIRADQGHIKHRVAQQVHAIVHRFQRRAEARQLERDRVADSHWDKSYAL